MRTRALLCLSLLAGCSRSEKPAPQPGGDAPATSRTVDKGDGCLVEITREGAGPTVGIGKEIVLEYDARVDDTGPPIASTRDWSVPCRLRLGDPTLIRGLTRGLEGLKVGSSARIEVPPDLAYGKGGKPESGVPADALLVFEVRILGAR